MSAKLVIEAGVVIQFAPDTNLTVDGRSDGILDAQGTEAEPAVLTGELKEKGSWRGVYIDNVVASQNRLDWTIIEYGGGSEIGSGLGASNLGIGGFVGISTMGITNSTFRHSAGFGVEVEGVSGFAAFENNTFEDNDDYVLSLGANQRGKVDPQTTFVGEGPDAGVNIHGGSVSTDQTWQNLKDGAITSVTDPIAPVEPDRINRL